MTTSDSDFVFVSCFSPAFTVLLLSFFAGSGNLEWDALFFTVFSDTARGSFEVFVDSCKTSFFLGRCPMDCLLVRRTLGDVLTTSAGKSNLFSSTL